MFYIINLALPVCEAAFLFSSPLATAGGLWIGWPDIDGEAPGDFGDVAWEGQKPQMGYKATWKLTSPFL